MSNPTPIDERHIYTVSELNQDVRTLLESGFPSLWLEGEISNFIQAASGHWYFSLKDTKAQVRCAMFKGRSMRVGFVPKQGDKVVIKAKISLYEARGDYQLIVESMEEAGFGALQRQFEALKKKLQAEGLFNAAVKKPLPDIPKQIGVITSPNGAAIRDIISVLKRRFPAIPVIVYPTLVQGDEAPKQIIKAIAKANQHKACDVLIVARGGGSLEDLWAFNDEMVARTIFQSHIPTISAVGHEIDVTIADFVADQRAPTPSAAAEMIVPDQDDFKRQLQQLRAKLLQLTQQNLKQHKTQLMHLQKRLKHPAQKLQAFSQRLDELDMRIKQAIQRQLRFSHQQLKQNQRILFSYDPKSKILTGKQQIHSLKQKIAKQIQYLLQQKQHQLSMQAKTLHTVSPLATLQRGYAIASQRNNNCIIRTSKQVKKDDEIKLQLHQGKLICRVKEIIDT